MTSELPKKPPITACSIPSRTIELPRAALAALLAISWAVSPWVPAAGAGDGAVETAAFTTDADDSSHVKPVAYTAGASKRKLQWLPVRPTKAQLARYGQRESSHRQALPEPEPIPVGPRVDPFDDPFGDSMGVSRAEPRNPSADNGTEPPAFQPDFQPPPGLLEPEAPGEAEEIEVPSLEDALAQGPDVAEEECPSVEELKRIHEITYDISPEEGRFPPECTIGKNGFQPRAWAPTTFTWKASGLCHKAAYFQDTQLERYGHSWGPYLQPLASGAHFFLSVPALPYSMGLYPPGECLYTLGFYRPGNCAPYMLDPLPVSVRAALAAGGAYTGLAFLIP